MKIINKNEKNYYIQSRNYHLMNVLEKDYYIELGVIDIEILERILNKETVNFDKIYDIKLLSEGIGKITGDIQNDLYYQLNYLINLRLKNSTCKFCLTAGIVKYLDEENCEKYAPIILIPIDFDYQKLEIVISGDPLINPLLLKRLAANNESTKIDNKKITDYYNNLKLNKVSDLDNVIYIISKEFNAPVDPANYITIVQVEYRDFIIEKDFMSIENSVNQMSEKTIFKRYFDEIKAIFPTNTLQKYVLLKASDGDRFAVDGKLGTGKTYTILNIIVDFIAKNKKILYVNQDADNIFDVEKNLTYLGLNPYTYNLTKNLREIIKPEAQMENVDISSVSSTILDDIFKLPEILQSRINGFKITNIFEYLAVLKTKYSNIYEIPLETVLESHEATSIYHDLIKIEQCLAQIDLYANNIWHKLQVSHNNLTSSEIISRIQTWDHTHNELYSYLLSFVKKFDLKLPTNINELYKLITYTYSFSAVRPLSKWENVEVRKEITKQLRDIQSLIDTNYNINSYYSRFVSNKYRIGRMKKIVNTISAEHIKIDVSLNCEDEKVINLLINFNDNLELLINRINNNVKKIKEYNHEFSSIFNFIYQDNSTYKFLSVLNSFLSKNKYNPFIFDTYYTSQSLFSKNGEAVCEAFIVYSKNKVFLPKYLKRNESLSREILDLTMKKKNHDKVLAHLLNTKLLKKDGINPSVVIENIKKYYYASKIISDNLGCIFGNRDFDDEFVVQFINFYQFITELNIHEKTYFKILLDKLNKESNRERYINKVISALKGFFHEENNTNEICKTLKNYKIIIEETIIYNKVDKLSFWNEYLKEVNQLKKEIKEIFNSKQIVEYSDLAKLMKIDAQYDKIHKTLNDKENTYKETLGIYYRGLDTVISEIGRTIEHYDEFLKLLNHPENINELFKDEIFSQFLDSIKNLDKLYATWMNRYRTFSVCFKGSQPETLTNSFETNKKLFKQFIDKSDQIKPIITINELTEGFLEYGLYNLHNGIRSCKYGENVSKHFIYSVLKTDFDEALKAFPTLSNMEDLLKPIDDYLLYEAHYCQNNLQNLIDNTANLSSNNPVSAVFNNYNAIVKQKIKNKNLFYADLDVFNSNLNLDQFDLVIIDDVHLSSANKYYRINECKQVIVFGDHLFQTSVSNALMKRLNDNCKITYHRRYLKANSKFNNPYDYDNQYIYSYDFKYDIKMCETFDDFIEEIFKRFKKNPKRIINILITNESTRRLIYTSIVSLLATTFNPEEIKYILCYNIRILNSLTEGNRYVNDVLVYFDDFVDLEESLKNLVFKNFINAHNDVVFYYIKSKIDAQNLQRRTLIKQLIGNEINNCETNHGTIPYLKQAIEKQGLTVNDGFGKFDLVIRNNQTYGIIVFDKEHADFTRFVDDYLYYYYEYQKRGWKVKIIFNYNLYLNFEQTVDNLIKDIKNGN